jgi:uncharacterized protein YkwD
VRLAFLLLLIAAPVRAQECAPDEALNRAASELLARDVSSRELAAIIRTAGSDAPAADALVIRDGDAERRARFLVRVASRRDGPLICGEARTDARWVVIAAAHVGSLEPIDGGVRVWVEPTQRAPRLYAIDADGARFDREVRTGETVHLPGDLVPPIRVQLVADGPRGPRPIAERDLGGGTTRVAPHSELPIEARLATLRAEEDAGALRENRLLMRVAADHAERVCAQGRVEHVGEGGDPRERLERAGVSARHVGEVVARAEGTGDAYAAALESPSHRAALVDPRFTDVGIAGARHDDRACLVVLLAAWPRVVPRR